MAVSRNRKILTVESGIVFVVTGVAHVCNGNAHFYKRLRIENSLSVNVLLKADIKLFLKSATEL